MSNLTEKDKQIFHDIVIAHSPAALKGKITNGVKLVQRGFDTGGDTGMETLALGVGLLNQVISRYELLKQAEGRVEVLHGK